MIVSVGSSATGNFTELDLGGSLHTDTVVANDTTSLKFVPGASSGTVALTTVSTVFNNTSSTDTITRLSLNDSTYNINGASATIYETIAGENASTQQSTEPPAKCRIRKDGTLKNAAIYIRTNSRTTDTTFTLRKNAANTSLVITLHNGDPVGWYEDTNAAHNVSVAAGDDVDWAITTGTGTENLAYSALCVDYVNSDGYFPLICANADAPGVSDNSIRYTTLAGFVGLPGTTQTQHDVYSSNVFIFSELTALVTANDVGSASNVTLMKNAAATTLVATITANTSQLYADSTHTVIAGPSDLLNYRITVPSVSGTHSVTIKSIVVWGKEPTRLYFHAANSTVSGTLPTTVQAALGAPTQLVDAATVNRTMDTNIGTSQTSLAMPSISNNTKQYFSRFCSPPLNQTSIAANTWFYSFAAAESSLSGNFPVSGTAQVLNVTLYVWRPSNGTKIATIKDGNGDASFNEPTVINTETSVIGSFAGSAAASISVGDILCLEVYFAISPSQPSANTVYYDGTTETLAAGTTVSSHSAFIASPETFLFVVGANVVRSLDTETVTFTEAGLTLVRGKIRAATTETLSIQETKARLSTKQRALTTETVTVTEPAPPAWIKARNISKSLTTETLTISSETVGRLSAKLRALTTETVNVSESSFVRLAQKIRALATETVSVSESVAQEKTGGIQNITRALTTETVSFTEGISKASNKLKSLATETVTIASETLARLKAVHKVLVEGTDNPACLEFVKDSLQFVNCGTSSTLALGMTANSEISYSGWFNTPADTASHCAIMNRGQYINFYPYIQHDGPFGCDFDYVTAPSWFPYVTGVTRGVWHHFVVSHSDINDLSYVAIDGSIRAVNHVDDYLDSGIGDARFTIGALSAGAAAQTEYFNGKLDELRVYNVQLTTDEIEILRQGGTVDRGLVAYWNCDEGAGGTIKDQIGTNNGTITGATWSTSTEPRIKSRGMLITEPSAPTWLKARNVSKSLTTETLAISEGLAKIKGVLWTFATETLIIGEVSLTRLKAAIRSHTTETLAISETSARIKAVLKSLPTETQTIGEGALARLKASIRSHTAESLDISESSARLKASIRSFATETLDISESVPTKLKAVTRALSTETLDISESLNRLGSKIRAFATETVSIVESVERTVYVGTKQVEKALTTETLEIAESVTKQIGLVKTLATETLNFSESIGILREKIRTLTTETINISEPSLPTWIKARNVSKALTTETLEIVEGIGRSLAKIRSMTTETLDFSSESISRLSAKARALPTETVTISTETLSRAIGIMKALATETLDISEGLTRRIGIVKSLATESLDISEVKTRLTEKYRELTTETLEIVENLSRVAEYAEREGLVITEFLTRTVTHAAAVTRSLTTETLNISESIDRLKAASRSTATESLNISESIATRLDKIRALATETLDISESIARARSMSKALTTETLNFSESIVTRLAKVRALATETLTLTEAGLNRFAVRSKSLATETLNITESVEQHLTTGAKDVARSLTTETLNLSESIARQSAKIKALTTETLNLTEGITKIAQKIRALTTETLNISESTQKQKGKARALTTETLNLSESLNRLAAKIRTSTATLTITEGITRSAGRFKSLTTETVAISESLTKISAKVRVITETVIIAEGLSRLANKFRALAPHTITISEFVSAINGLGIRIDLFIKGIFFQSDK